MVLVLACLPAALMNIFEVCPVSGHPKHSTPLRHKHTHDTPAAFTQLLLFTPTHTPSQTRFLLSSAPQQEVVFEDESSFNVQWLLAITSLWQCFFISALFWTDILPNLGIIPCLCMW